MEQRYALADLNARRWDEDAPVEGDPEDVANLAGLLSRVRYAWSGFVQVFHVSGSEARTGLIRRHRWEKASHFLKAVEDMARGLLLLMALALPSGGKRLPRPPLAAPHEASPVPPSEPHEVCKYPDISLSVVSWLIDPEAGAAKTAGLASRGWRLANRWHRLRGLVCRTDALLRILNDPAPFARRVARRLDGLNRKLRFRDYKPPRPPRLLRRNEPWQEMKPGNPYRHILAPLWAHCADRWAARENPG